MLLINLVCPDVLVAAIDIVWFENSLKPCIIYIVIFNSSNYNVLASAQLYQNCHVYNKVNN